MNRRRYKRIAALLCALILFSVLQDFLYIQPAEGATRQITVTGYTSNTPGFYWCQHLDGHWSTQDSFGGFYTAADAGGKPAGTTATFLFNIGKPGSWNGDGGPYAPDEVTDIRIKAGGITLDTSVLEAAVGSNPVFTPVGDKLQITALVGSPATGKVDNACGASPSYTYVFPVIVQWEATVTITEPDPTPTPTLTPTPTPAPTPTPTPTPSENEPPVAKINVGLTQTTGAMFTAYGDQSYDPDGSIVDFSWNVSPAADYQNADDSALSLRYDRSGSVKITLTVVDDRGATNTATANVSVIDPNPIPVITVPDVIRENHPIAPNGINGDKSYSPIGRSIDHSKDIWTGKKSVYTTPGPQIVTLEVFDSAGLKSLYPVSKTFTVLPDEPPIAKVDVPPLGIRNQTYDFFNKSYSPDGDIITSVTYRYKYDVNNNGFIDDAWVALPGDMTKASLKPTKVGKYQIEITAIENYGKTAKDVAVLDVINQAPAVSFLMEGKNEQPNPDSSVIYTPNQIMNWDLYAVNSTSQIKNKNAKWTLVDGELAGGLGRKAEDIDFTTFQFGMSGPYANALLAKTDFGFGANSISPYRAIDPNKPYAAQPMPFPSSLNNLNYSLTTEVFHVNGNKSSFDNIKNIFTNSRYVYIEFQRDGHTQLLAMNKSKIGDYHLNFLYPPVDGSTIEHIWVNGNPYDFAITTGSSATDDIYLDLPYYFVFSDWNAYRSYQTSFDDSLMTPYLGYYPDRVTDWGSKADFTVADRTIYKVTLKGRPDGDHKVAVKESYGGFTETYDLLLNVESYDAFTGQKIASSLDSKLLFTNRPVQQLIPSGDNLIVILGSTSYNINDMILTFDRKGHLISKSIAPIIEKSMYYSPDNAMRTFMEIPLTKYYIDAEGDLYQEVSLRCMDCSSGYNNDARNYKDNYVKKVDIETGDRIFTTHLTGQWPVCYSNQFSCYYTGDSEDKKQFLIINNESRQILVRSFSPDGLSVKVYLQAINMDTGASSSFPFNFTGIEPNNLNIDQDGQYSNSGVTGTLTVDGYRTASSTGLYVVEQSNTGVQYSLDPVAPSGGILSANTMYASFASNAILGMYIGDGLYLAFLGVKTYSNPVDMLGTSVWLIKGTPTSDPKLYNWTTLGQFVSPNVLDDSVLTFSLGMKFTKDDKELAGFSFRMTDPKNRYAVETDGSTLYLSKYVNGARTVLKSSAYPFQDNVAYNFKISTQGSVIAVYLNGTPYLNATDSTFTSGKFGPFSDKPYVQFSNISQKQLSTPDVEWLTSYAIWDAGEAKADVRYSNIAFTDPENDPLAGNYQWSIEHTPKFLNNQGLSAMNGKTFTAPVLSFDKVGLYKVTLKARDDPNSDYPYPDGTFAEYREWSNEYFQMITVHRRPVAQFSLSAAADGTVVWNDTSYDPDRWASPTIYSTEDTGIDYKATRGILERKYYYVTPSGTTVQQKLVTPQETGTYTVGLAVKDEYGAWSNWNEQTFTVNKITPPDQPPTAGFTVTPTTTYRGVPVSIVSTASDPEDGAAANLKHEYYIRNVTTGDAETLQSTSRGAWEKTFNSIGVMEIRQVVTDSKGQSAQVVKQVTVLNRAPAADFTWSPNPVWEGDTLVLFNTSTDPDGDALSLRWQIRFPNGQTLSYTGDTVAIPSAQPGNYSVTLTATDGYTTTAAQKTVPVQALIIEPQVMHTDLWLDYHVQKGHNTTAAPLDFFAGEKILAVARVSAAPVKNVTAWIDEIALDGSRLTVYADLSASDDDPTVYRGEIYDDRLVSLTEGLQKGVMPVHFKAEYANGVIKQADVPINILGSALKRTGVHRLD
ncbi:MAG TPA: PKD domain-containing protein [Bacilli bacterium]